MLDDLLYEIIKLKWVAIVNIAVIFLFGILFWILTREFKISKRMINLFSPLFKLDKKQIICVALLIGRLMFVISSSIFCLDINIGHLIIFVFFTVMIFVLNKDVKMLASSFANYLIIFLLIFIENTLFNYYINIEKMWFIIIMAVLIGVFAVLDSLISSLNSYQSIMKAGDSNA